MSQEKAISINDLSKCYQIYGEPQDRLKQAFWRDRKQFFKEFWALKNISFDVKKGETVGVLGRNGSGKSSLLQVICGTLAPSGGEVDVQGRIAALLELGAGFNPDFTGRENIFLNAAVLGMTREEIENRLEEIIAFSELENFMDQPVRTYSSGMYIRLGFSVAINVDPDILIIDEALAVGDEAFQRKCFSKIQSLQNEGKTILLVSHSAGAILELCNQAILLDQGEMILSGNPKQVVTQYQKLIYCPKEKVNALRNKIRAIKDSESSVTLEEENKLGLVEKDESEEAREYFDPNLKPKSTIRYENQGAHIKDIRIENEKGEVVNCLLRQSEYTLKYNALFSKEASRVRGGTLLKTITGMELGGLLSHPEGGGVDYVENGQEVEFVFKFRCVLHPGTYFFNTGVVEIKDEGEQYLDRLIDAGMFIVQPEKGLVALGPLDFSIR